MTRSLPSMTTTVSSEREIGLKYGYSPAAWTSRARVKFLHLSNSAMCCRVSVRNETSRSMSKRWYSLALRSRIGKAHGETCHSLWRLPRGSLDCRIRVGLGRSVRRSHVVPYVVRFLGVTALLCSLLPHVAAAQDQRHPRWEIPGFDFRRDGVWRKKGREVRAMRARLRAAGRFAELAAPIAGGAQIRQAAGPGPSATQISGVLNVPAILFRYKDSPAPQFVAADYDAVLFAATPSGGRPYTYRSFYNEMSNGVFDIQGQTFGYANLDSNEVYYTGGTSSGCVAENPFGSTNCNGLFNSLAIGRMQAALREALIKLDAQIDFSQYADTSGFV